MSKRKKIVVGILIIVALIIIVPLALDYLDNASFSGGGSSYPSDSYRSSPSRPRSYSNSGIRSESFSADLGLESGAVAALSASSSPFSRKSAAPPPASPSELAQGELKTERLVIKSGYMSVVAQDVSQTVATVTKMVEEAKGFVVESSLEDVTTSPHARMKVRVPAGGLDSFIEKVRGLASQVVSESISGEDVTEEYVDIQAQLRNLKASEAQFLKILGDAKTIEEVLNVQRELERVRNDIERAEGRKKYLEQSAAMSTLQLYIAAEEEALPTINPQQKWRPKAVFKSAVRSLILGAQGLANLAIRLVVLAPIWLPIVLIVWFIWRRHKRRVTTKA